jgi:hypothetical protein
MTLDEKKTLAADWFRALRDDICARFEAIEAEYATHMAHGTQGVRSASEPLAAGVVSAANEGGESPPHSKTTFTKTPWSREAGGAGEMSIMKGRVFEKVGVNISTVHGEFSEQFRKEIPGAEQNPCFWASGISLVAHMASPLVPAAHFNTRMICVGDGLRLWFGGGGDLNPMFENDSDTADFHAAFKTACDALDTVAAARDASWASTAMSPRSGAEQSNNLKASTKPLKAGAMSISSSRTVAWRAGWAAYSMIISASTASGPIPHPSPPVVSARAASPLRPPLPACSAPLMRPSIGRRALPSPKMSAALSRASTPKSSAVICLKAGHQSSATTSWSSVGATPNITCSMIAAHALA